MPYRLPQVRSAIVTGDTVYVMDGEKDVDRAATLGLAATCNAMGALKFRPEHARQLKGAARVVVVADCDPVGYRHAAHVVGLLAGLVDDVTVVQAVAAKDFSDHCDAGHGIAELVAVDPAQLQATDQIPNDQGRQQEMAHGKLVAGTDEGIHHSDEVDNIGRETGQVMQMLLRVGAMWAQQWALNREKEHRKAEAASEQAKREYQQRLAVELKAIEIWLGEIDDKWWNRASREEIARCPGRCTRVAGLLRGGAGNSAGHGRTDPGSVRHRPGAR